MMLYPKLLVPIDSATIPDPFEPWNITPNWAQVRQAARDLFPNTGPPADRWGTIWTDGERPNAKLLTGDVLKFRGGCISGTEFEPGNPTAQDVINDILASTIREDIKTAIRNALPSGLAVIEWQWNIKVAMEWEGNVQVNHLETEAEV